MTHRTRRPSPSIARCRRGLAPLALALVLVACGQKSGVHLGSDNGAAGSSQNGGAVTGAGPGAASAGAGVVGGAAAGGGAVSGVAAGVGGTARAPGGGGAGAGAAGGGATVAGPGAGAAAVGDSTGVTGDTIAIGIHAPATGAGAPAPSFDQGKDQYIKRQGFSQVMMIRGNTQNFEDAHAGFIAAARSLGLNVARDDGVPKDADAQTMGSEASLMCGSLEARTGKVAVYPLMSPKLFINLAGAAAGQQCFPRYAGIGITLGLNVVAQALCPTGALKNGASFFSPFQGLDAVDQVDPDFHKAYANGDDIGFALWGAEKLLTAQLKAAGRNLTRQSFVAAVQGKSFNTGVYPAVDFSQSHFGGTAVHVLKADCARNQYVTEAQNARSF